MNPFFRKPFMIISSVFLLSLILIYALLFHGFAAKWHWNNENASQLSSYPYSRYDWRTLFTAPSGLLIKTETDSGAYGVDPYGQLYRQNNLREYTLYFSDKAGMRYITQGEGSLYNVYCVSEKCILFTDKGRRIFDLTTFTLSDLIEWQNNNNSRYFHYPSALIGGKLLFSQSSNQLVLADNNAIMMSLDEGQTWPNSIDTASLVKQYYAENFGEFTQFHYAVTGDLLLIFYNHHYTTNTLEMTYNLVNKTVTQTRWLPIRIIEVAQNQQGELYFIAKQASRELYSIIHYQADGALVPLYESGYKSLSQLKISRDYLLVNKGINDDEVAMVFSLKSKDYTYHQKITDDMLFNPALSRFVQLIDNYGDKENVLTVGKPLKYRYAMMNE